MRILNNGRMVRIDKLSWFKKFVVVHLVIPGSLRLPKHKHNYKEPIAGSKTSEFAISCTISGVKNLKRAAADRAWAFPVATCMPYVWRSRRGQGIAQKGPKIQMMMYAYLAAGFVLLLGGAELMVRGAVGLAEKLSISKIVIGMTVVAFGTSAPELIVSLTAALSGSAGLAIGNLVGSNIANILLILGVSGLILPIAVDSKTLTRDGWVLVGGTAAFMALVLRGEIDLSGGLLLLLLFAGFLYYSYRRETAGPAAEFGAFEGGVDDIEGMPETTWLSVVLLVIGFAGLIGGAELLVNGGVAIARTFGVSEAAIGLTIIAFGTSLPELAASVVAAYRKHADLALGNIVGSNIFNIVGIAGVVAVVSPLNVPARIVNFDMIIMAVATLLLMPFMIGNQEVISRPIAGLYLAAYLGYIAFIAAGVESLRF